MRPAPRTSRATLASLGPRGACPTGGHSTRHSSGPARLRSPATTGRTGTPAAAAARCTDRACSAGSSKEVAWITPTDRPRSTPVRPPTWSAWKCVSSSSGTRRTPRARRHSSTGRGSGPVSTTTASPGPRASTAASPCPTAHWTWVQPGGGQPVSTRVNGGGRRTASSTTTASAGQTQRVRRPREPRTTTPRVAAASSRPPTNPPGQANSAPGSRAPLRATAAIHPAGTPAHPASTSAAGIDSGAAASAAKPSTVAGPAASSASRLHGTATRLTRAASTATTGAHTAWAAAAAASASAGRGGTPRPRSASPHRGARVSRAPVARTERRKP